MKGSLLAFLMICAACFVTFGHIRLHSASPGILKHRINSRSYSLSLSSGESVTKVQRASSSLSAAEAILYPATIFVDLSILSAPSNLSAWLATKQTEELLSYPLPNTLRAVAHGAEIAFIRATERRRETHTNVTVCVNGRNTLARDIVTTLVKALTGHTVRCNESHASLKVQIKGSEAIDDKNRRHLILASPSITGLPQKLEATSCNDASSRDSTNVTQLSPSCPPPRTILVILGNKPLDPHTPSLDNVMRGVHAAKTYLSLRVLSENSTDSTLPMMVVPTGGYVVRGLGLTEAAQLSFIMQYFGVPHGDIFTENSATTTVANAKFVKKLLVKQYGISTNAVPNVVVITKKTHMKSALTTMKRHFRQAKAVQPQLIVSPQAMIADISEHLAWRQVYKPDPNPKRRGLNGFLEWRLDNLRNKRVRTD